MKCMGNYYAWCAVPVDLGALWLCPLSDSAENTSPSAGFLPRNAIIKLDKAHSALNYEIFQCNLVLVYKRMNRHMYILISINSNYE